MLHNTCAHSLPQLWELWCATATAMAPGAPGRSCRATVCCHLGDAQAQPETSPQLVLAARDAPEVSVAVVAEACPVPTSPAQVHRCAASQDWP